jgi:hypothetical protein
MKTQLTLTTAAMVSLLSCTGFAQNIVVDPGFDTGFVGAWWSSGNFGGGNFPQATGVAASGALIYDDGWITYTNASGSAHWEVSGGKASRTAETQYQYGGFGQIVTSPGGDEFEIGGELRFSFDYANNDSGTQGLVGSLYGIEATNGTSATWNLAADECIDGMGQANTPTINVSYTAGTDYQFYLLDTFAFGITGDTGSGTYTSDDIDLTREYELFAIVFQGDPDGSGAGQITIDNVSVTAAPIVPPGTLIAIQ